LSGGGGLFCFGGIGLFGGIWLGWRRLGVERNGKKNGCSADDGAGCGGSEFEVDGHDLQFNPDAADCLTLLAAGLL
jgi:hypothetical protein